MNDESSKIKIVGKPPVRLLSPGSNYLYKKFTSNGITILLIVIGIMISFWAISTVPFETEEGYIGKEILYIGCLVTAAITILLSIYYAIGIPWLIRTISYEITEEVLIVRRGRITKVEIFVPFRTITNIGIIRGPIDRLFNIGHIHIETAGTALGFSGKLGVDQYIEGLKDEDLREIYNFLYSKMRKLKGIYSTTTEEIPIDHEENDKSLVEVMQVLITEIRDLKRVIEKL